VKLDVGWKSDRGLNPDRPENEDSCAAARRQSDRGMVTIAVVADGLGGMEQGRAASEAALASFLRAEAVPSIPTRPAFASWLNDEMYRANDAVRQALQGASGGTTCTAVALLGNVLVLSHIGDTRAYLASGGEVRVLTTDHSLDEALRAAGQPVAADGSGRSALLRSLGSHDALPTGYVDHLDTRRVVGDTKWTKFLGGETILLCSDGLWDVVPFAVISDLLTSERSAQSIVNMLIQHTLDAGAPDNVSALVLRRVASSDQQSERREWGPGPAIQLPPPIPSGESRTKLPSVPNAVSTVVASNLRPEQPVEQISVEPEAARSSEPKSNARKSPLRVAVPALVGAALAVGAYGVFSQRSPSASAPATQASQNNRSVTDLFLTREYWGREVAVAKTKLGAAVVDSTSNDAVVVGEVARSSAGTLSIRAISVADAKQFLTAGGLVGKSVSEIQDLILATLPAVRIQTALNSDQIVTNVEAKLVDDTIALVLTGDS
jgi:serine/threonine protein phosphatase PrpC